MDLLAPRPAMVPHRCIAAGSVRRLCISLILAEQGELVAKGHMPQAAMIPLQDPRLSVAERDTLRIDEAGLGFDSLARLGLILRVNRFFNLHDSGVEDYLLLHRTLGEWVALIGQHLRIVGASARFTFDTSGSAGPVKHITHALQHLQAEVGGHLSGPLSYLTPGARILSLVPPQHIYGFLFSCLLPDHLGIPAVSLHHLGPTAAFRQAQAGDLVVGTPFNWQTLRATGLHLPPGVTGITSAGPSDAGTWSVRPTNGLSRLTEIYGSTETGGLGARSEEGVPFRLLPHLFCHDGAVHDPTKGPDALIVQDVLDWDSASEFRVLGRKDDVVQVGGVNVSPLQVVAVLRGMEGVADAAVRLGTERLCAFVVPGDPTADLTLLEQALRGQIARLLPAPARPATLTFGPTLPRSSMGKLCDWPDAVQSG